MGESFSEYIERNIVPPRVKSHAEFMASQQPDNYVEDPQQYSYTDEVLSDDISLIDALEKERESWVMPLDKEGNPVYIGAIKQIGTVFKVLD